MPRRLGQHFLRPESVEELLRVIAPAAGDVFLEIGPGQGALTLPLAERCARVVAVEIDEALARRLRATAPPNVEIVTHDALTADLRGLVPEGARLAGNLPYYVSSPLLRLFLGLHGHVRDLHVMLQEEVARRVASPPGSKEYGILSVLYGLWADIDLPARFPPACFSPPPGVTSAVLRARFRDAPRADGGRPGRSSSGSSREPSPAGAEPLKTTSKIAILTSRNTLGSSTSRGPGERRRYRLWSWRRSGRP